MLELLQRHLKAFSDADWNAYKADLAPNVIYEEVPTGKRASNADEFIEAVKFWKRAFPDAKGTIKRYFEAGDIAVTEVEWEGTHAGPLDTPFGPLSPTNKRVGVSAVLINNVRDGKIVESKHYFDLMTLMLQLGAGATRPAAATAEAQPMVH